MQDALALTHGAIRVAFDFTRLLLPEYYVHPIESTNLMYLLY